MGEGCQVSLREETWGWTHTKAETGGVCPPAKDTGSPGSWKRQEGPSLGSWGGGSRAPPTRSPQASSPGCERIGVCCFKACGLGSLVTAAPGSRCTGCAQGSGGDRPGPAPGSQHPEGRPGSPAPFLSDTLRCGCTWGSWFLPRLPSITFCSGGRLWASTLGTRVACILLPTWPVCALRGHT